MYPEGLPPALNSRRYYGAVSPGSKKVHGAGTKMASPSYRNVPKAGSPDYKKRFPKASSPRYKKVLWACRF